jgi:hypothetical protein
MVRLTKVGSGVVISPFSVCLVCDMERGSRGVVVGNLGGGMFEVVGSNGGLGWEFNWGVSRGKEQSNREVAQTAEVIDSEGDKGDVVSV